MYFLFQALFIENQIIHRLTLNQPVNQSINQGFMGFPYFEKASQVEQVGKNPPASVRHVRDNSSIPGSGRFPWRRAWQPTPVFLPGESHGQRSLAGYSPQKSKELDITETTSKTGRL